MLHVSPDAYVSPQNGEYPPHTNVEALRADFEKVADSSAHTIDTPIHALERPDQAISQIAVRAEAGIYFNHLPQPLEITAEAATTLEGMMAEWFSHYPEEPTYAQTRFGVPMLLTRFDGTITPDGRIGLCEFDDVPTGFNMIGTVNPTARSYVDGLLGQLDAPLHSAQMHEAGYEYPHDDDAWLPSTNGNTPPDVAVIPRARRVAPGFTEFIDRFGPQSIVGAWERDHKGPLIAMGMGSLASNLSVVLELADQLKGTQPVFIKGLRSSRTEAAAVIATSKWHIRGNSTPSQVQRKFEHAGIDPNEDFPIVVQPYHRPPTMEELGLHFREDDSSVLASFQDGVRDSTESSRAQPGSEGKYSVLSRIYGVYLPDQGHKIIGGLWMARPNGAIIHGASDAITGPLNVAGLEPYTS